MIQRPKPPTSLHLASFDKKFQSGLVFSIFEGLEIGEYLVMVFKEKPDQLYNHFKKYIGPQFLWTEAKVGDYWEVILKKLGLEQER